MILNEAQAKTAQAVRAGQEAEVSKATVAAFVQRSQAATVNKVRGELRQGAFTPEAALQAWFAYLAPEAMLTELDQQIAAGRSAANRLNPPALTSELPNV